MDSRKGWSAETIVFLFPAVAFLLLVFIYPFIYAIQLSFTDGTGAFTLANYIKYFSNVVEMKTILITLKISLPVTVLSIVLAVPSAYFMRRGIKHEKLISFFLMLPMTLGVVLIAEGMITYFGRNGWVMLLLEQLGLVADRTSLIHNYFGVVMSLFIQTFPMGLIILIGYTSGIHPNLEMASTMLGATKTQTFWRIMLPLMMPGILIAFALNFTSAFSVFTSAIMLGQPTSLTRVMAYAAYVQAYEYYDYNFSSTICILMIIIQLLIIGFVFALRNRLYKGATAMGKG
jgi:putative spermidine/putrescine transport system permease protein